MNVAESLNYIKQISKIAEEIDEDDFTVLVTGATGLIGSCIVDVFLYASKVLGKNIKIIALGRNEDKLRKRFYYNNCDNISFLAQDIMEPLKYDGNIDYIIHAASNADPISYSLHPVETLLTNIYGTNNILEYCRHHDKTRTLLTSTFEVYGKIDSQDNYSEDDSGEVSLNEIRSCYPESKRCSEILMRCYKKEYDIDFVIARLCSIYGPTMAENDSKAHAQFIRNGLKCENIVLKSKGNQIRTYCYLMDAVSGMMTILFHGESGEVYNVSYEKSVATIAQVAETVSKICGTKVVYDIPDLVEKNGFSRPQNCILDNSKLRKLGWLGKYSLYEGLKSTIDILNELS